MDIGNNLGSLGKRPKGWDRPKSMKVQKLKVLFAFLSATFHNTASQFKHVYLLGSLLKLGETNIFRMLKN